MLDNNNMSNLENRNLSEVFKELQEIKSNPKSSKMASKEFEKQLKHNKKLNTFKSFKTSKNNSTPSIEYPNDLKLSHIVVGCSILVVSFALFFPKDVSFSRSFAREDKVGSANSYELNRHHLDMQHILSENTNIDYKKTHLVEEREVEFEKNFTEIPSLPKGEEVVKQEGVNGKDKFTVIQTFENDKLIEETILKREKVVEPIPKLIDLGSSEFLAKNKVHIGDKMYLKSSSDLKEKNEKDSNSVAELKEFIDVKLLELPSEEWAKVSFDGIEGYIKTDRLTSSSVNPAILEKNRIQRILLKVNLGMELNKPSGLSLKDYEKIFSNLDEDTESIFYNHYKTFYNIEKKYNINGIFLAAMAIHESSWGTSQIAKEKHNLFGYGSFDNNPLQASFDFDTYEEGIETVAKSLVMYYLNPTGTKIYDGELAKGWFYNGPTLTGVNTRYASDSEWHNKVFKHMEMLYNRLK